jgi:hypothetical protein
MTSYNLKKILLALLVTSSIFWTSVQAEPSGRQIEQVDWLAGPAGRIKSIRYFKVKQSQTESIPNFKLFSTESTDILTLNTIDSPPIDGFVPWIAVAVTDKRSLDDDWVAQTHTSVVGRHLTNSPETNFVIGLFDTGASIHLIGHAAANRTGIYDADLLTPSITELAGAVNSVFAQVSHPLALFMDGLAAIDSDSMTVDESRMVGQSNVSVAVGDEPAPGQPDLPTVIGSPMSIYFVTVINNENPITITQDGNDLTSPDIRFYSHGDSRIPSYENTIPLNLIPAGGLNVQYTIDFDAIMDLTFQPGSPSAIFGLGSQSLFFVNSVDLQDDTRSAIDKQHFMVDTGAQITVISSGVGSRLGLNPANPDFEVDIQDITGQVTIHPGFYLDSLDIPALGDWLSFTNVPVVLLDVGSPEGGFLDGIIGMNLFTEFNLVLRGGGLFGQDPPSLDFERIPPPLNVDIAPEEGDGIVDFLDIAAFGEAWLATPASPNWNPKANLAPRFTPDNIINFLDFAVLAEYWFDSAVQ